MKFIPNQRISPEILERSEKDINAVNAYVDSLKGTIVTVQTIQSGQSRPYADHVYESLIFCHIPNGLLTAAPLPRVINIEQAKAIARIFVHSWEDTPANWASPVLEFIRPEANPCGLAEHDSHNSNGLHACWRVRVRLSFTG